MEKWQDEDRISWERGEIKVGNFVVTQQNNDFKPNKTWQGKAQNVHTGQRNDFPIF